MRPQAAGDRILALEQTAGGGHKGASGINARRLLANEMDIEFIVPVRRSAALM